jgi:hypothetical protein
MLTVNGLMSKEEVGRLRGGARRLGRGAVATHPGGRARFPVRCADFRIDDHSLTVVLVLIAFPNPRPASSMVFPSDRGRLLRVGLIDLWMNTHHIEAF